MACSFLGCSPSSSPPGLHFLRVPVLAAFVPPERLSPHRDTFLSVAFPLVCSFLKADPLSLSTGVRPTGVGTKGRITAAGREGREPVYSFGLSGYCTGWGNSASALCIRGGKSMMGGGTLGAHLCLVLSACGDLSSQGRSRFTPKPSTLALLFPTTGLTKQLPSSCCLSHITSSERRAFSHEL